ncbi:MAG TPA: serine/threonine-protein kinase [Streptosporangiaceae bacterium]|nr:serine/threonine-protein kinase [Streptosporangiaceae bacterium]
MTQDNPGVPGSFGPGARIAGYRLEEQIGQGGMAVVFRAHDERLDRTVALKILAPALAADEAFRQRFIRESRAAAAVDDPHIIPVFEAGESSGVLFIAMRYVRGGDVRSMLGQLGPLPPGRVAEVISQVAGALDAAHARGLVHRDVKPANMLLDARPGGGRPDHVYLSDFGLSKASLQATGLTGTGMFLGTLDYIAPEQIEGRPVDGRADQYALACAAYELITGSPPFVRNDAMAVMYAQLTEPPPPVTSRRPDLSAAVDRVFAQAMAKPAEQRYATCTEFALALRDAFGIRPYDSGPGSAPSHPMTQIVVGASGDRGAGGAGGSRTGSAGRDPAEATQQRDSTAGGSPTRLAGGTGRDTSPDLTAAHWQSQQASHGGQPPPYSAQPPYGGQVPYGDQGGGQPRGRSRWRSPGVIAAAAALLVILAGGGGYLGLHHHSGKTSTTRTTALTLPGCTTTAANGPSLKVPSKRAGIQGGNPFGILTSQDGKFVFAITRTTLQVLSRGPGLSLTTAHNYVIAASGRQAAGATMTHDGKYLLVAAGSGVTVLSAASAEAGAGPIVGTLTDPNIGNGQAVSVAVGRQDKFVFVTLKSGNVVAVFNLRKAVSTGSFDSSDFVGAVPIGSNPVGLTISPDNHWLYVTSNTKNDPHGTGPGLLSVLNVQKAEADPANSIKAQDLAGCQPSRVTTSADGATVWVTARGSNAVLGFNAPALRTSGSRHALIAKVPVGQTPIGLALVNGGSRLVVADTDVNHTSRLADNLAVVNVPAALGGKPALLGFIQSGDLPREFGVVPGGRYLLVSDNGSAQIQVVDLSKLP